jgi:Rieske Fe-S protein
MLKKPDAFPIAATAEQGLDRRRFLCAAGSAAALVLVGEWGAKRLDAAASASSEEVRLDAASELQIGAARVLGEPSGTQVLAVRLDESTVVAFDRRCPHLGCPVLWSAERGQFECPCHHAAFDARTGAVLYGPPRRGLTPITINAEQRGVG